MIFTMIIYLLDTIIRIWFVRAVLLNENLFMFSTYLFYWIIAWVYK